MEYVFVFDPECKTWWLKITTMDQLLDYVKKTERPAISGGFQLYWDLYTEMTEKNREGKGEEIKSVMEYLEMLPIERRFSIMVNRQQDYNMMYAAIRRAEDNETPILEGFRSLNIEFGIEYAESLHKDGVVYINPAGGRIHHLDYTQFCRKKELSFPHFTEKDIRIKQFNGGKHYYAHVGNVEVKDGDARKWDTYDEAYKAAKALVEN